MMTPQKHPKRSDLANKKLFRKLFELQMELEKYDDETPDFNEDLIRIIESIDQILEMMIHEE